MFETVLASKRVYEGHILNLRVDQIRTPTGVKAIREIVEHGGAVAVVPIDGAGQVILVRQYRHAVRALVTEVPAGKLDGDEDPRVAAQRELREETGYQAKQLEHLGGIHPAPAWSTEFIDFYLAADLIPGPTARDADEAIELMTIPLSKALNLIQTGVITDGKTVAALLLAQQHLNSTRGKA